MTVGACNSVSCELMLGLGVIHVQSYLWCYYTFDLNLYADGHDATEEELLQMRRRIANEFSVFKLSETHLSATLDAMAEVLGSTADARHALRRALRLFATGSSNIRHNWAALLALLGDDAATARKAVLNYPGLLKFDMSRAVYQQRIRFYQQKCDASLGQVLNGYVEKSLVLVGPRVAWVRRHRPADPAKPIPLWVLQCSDVGCMERCGVPLEGYAEFKAAWLASAEGREWCKYEAGAAAKSVAAAEDEDSN
jgi:hypothetical protein